MIILKNSIQCRLCGDVIESRHRHDYVHCKCGACGADGGLYYLRRTAPSRDSFLELSVVQEDEPRDQNRKDG